MKISLQHTPLFLFLIPVFFVWHGFLENFGFVSPGNCLLLMVLYCGIAAVLYLLCLAFFRDQTRAALMASWFLSFYLFFGALHDFLKLHAAFLHRYSLILPLFLGSVVILSIYFRKSKSKFRLATGFINTLFLVYLLVDLSGIIWKTLRPPADMLTVYSPAETNKYTACADCTRPDIYFLLFDEYESTSSLQEQFHYENSDLDSFLVTHGFHIQRMSSSNYNFTPFSLASIMNMSYLQGIQFPNVVNVDDYGNCNVLIRNDEVIKFLSHQGYDIVNYSVFDLAGNPSPVEESFLPLSTKLITERTLLANLQKDIGWILYTGKLKLPWVLKKNLYLTFENNNKFMDLVKKESGKKSKRPRFVYAHFYLPHPPFFFDRRMNPKNEATVYHEYAGKPVQAYLDYLPYTNRKVEELIGTIQQNTHDSAVIVFMGDHGFRYADQTIPGSFNFRNQNAVYFPGKDYRLLYDSISGVNQFRVIFNQIFHQQLPLLKDSVIFLRDKK